jgi:ribonuclease-3
MSEDVIQSIEQMTRHRFMDPGLVVRALTHSSMVDQRLDSNERLEFLGDAVLGIVACERIFERFPDLLEGEMTKIKSAAVSRAACAHIATGLGLDRLLALGKGMKTQGAIPSSLSAGVLESVIGALYLDAGFAVARAFILEHLDPLIDKAWQSGHHQNYKSVLQQHAQTVLACTPFYRILDEKGPDHAKCFKVGVEIGERKFLACWGKSKKQAEQEAAMAALRELGVLEAAEDGEYRVVNGNGHGNGEETERRSDAETEEVASGSDGVTE